MNHLCNTKLCKITNRLHLDIICFGYATFGSEWNGEILNPEFSRLYYIMNGASCITINGHKTTLTKGNWYLVPAGHSFKYSCPEYAEHIYYHLRLHDNYETDILNRFSCVSVISSPLEDTALLADNIETTDAVVGMKIHQNAHCILSLMFEKYNIDMHQKKLSPCVASAIEYIRANLSAKLTVDDVVAHTYVSKSTLSKKFQSELSISVMSYISDMIISKAKLMLTQTSASIAEISEQLGFSDQFYFSKRFKMICGVSPIKFRKMPRV